MILEKNQFDLGEVFFGKERKFEVKVKNNYSIPLHITKLVAGCSSCTSLDVDMRILAPKETATITVKFKPGSTGIQKKQASVYYKVGDNHGSEVITFTAVCNK